MVLSWIIGSTFLISLLALVGAVTLSINKIFFQKLLLSLVAVSAGGLMGGAFLHLLPEAIEQFGAGIALFSFILLGFIVFLLIEKILHWRHCHKQSCKIHTFAYMNLIGEGVHNFIDGLVIATSFIVSIPLGIATTIAIALHEIPQEIGEFGILVYGGFSKTKALLVNFAVALTIVLGGIIGFFLSDISTSSRVFLLPFAAGGFIYIAASDLIPELRKEEKLRLSWVHFILFIAGISILYLLRLFVKV